MPQDLSQCASQTAFARLERWHGLGGQPSSSTAHPSTGIPALPSPCSFMTLATARQAATAIEQLQGTSVGLAAAARGKGVPGFLRGTAPCSTCCMTPRSPPCSCKGHSTPLPLHHARFPTTSAALCTCGLTAVQRVTCASYTQRQPTRQSASARHVRREHRCSTAMRSSWCSSPLPLPPLRCLMSKLLAHLAALHPTLLLAHPPLPRQLLAGATQAVTAGGMVQRQGGAAGHPMLLLRRSPHQRLAGGASWRACMHLSCIAKHRD